MVDNKLNMTMVDFDTNLIAIVFLTIVFFFLSIYFYYQFSKKNQPLFYLVITCVLGFVSSLIASIDTIFFSERLDSIFSRINFRLFLGLQVFFFFLFLSNFSDIKKYNRRLIVVISLLIVELFGIISLILFQNYAVENLEFQYKYAWFIIDFSLNLMGFIVYGLYAVPIFITLYKYNKEIRVYLTVIGFIAIASGYFFRLIFCSIANGKMILLSSLPEAIYFLKIIADYFIFAGLVIFVLIYLINSEFIYQLPYDQYFFFVSLKSGVLIQFVEFESKHKTIEIMENSFTSLLYAINLLFSYVFKTKNNISYIESQDTTFYLCTGEKITSIIVGNKVTPVLISDVKKFNRNFEQRYKIELEQDNTTLAQLDIPKNYFEKHFPYLVIRQKMVKNNLEIE
jgi:hypothetical protein